MGRYSGTIGRPDRSKAIAGVIAVHVLLAAVILTGLNVSTIRRAVEHMTTIDIADPPPPPTPPPAAKSVRSKDAEGAPAQRAEPTEIVAPPPKLSAPSPVVTAPVAGTGAAPSSAAAFSGNGTGAGGSSNGLGGGGTDDFSRFTPARLVRGFSPTDYAVLLNSGLRRGTVPTHLIVSRSGAVVNCTLLRSSGNSQVDSVLCPLISASFRFEPARNASGRPIDYNLDFLARWNPRSLF